MKPACRNPPLFLGDGSHGLADAVQFPLERKAVMTLQRKAEKQTDSSIQNKERFAVRSLDLNFTSANRCWIGNAPMSGHRLSGPQRANFFSGVVTNCEDEVELRR